MCNHSASFKKPKVERFPSRTLLAYFSELRGRTFYFISCASMSHWLSQTALLSHNSYLINICWMKHLEAELSIGSKINLALLLFSTQSKLFSHHFYIGPNDTKGQCPLQVLWLSPNLRTSRAGPGSPVWWSREMLHVTRSFWIWSSVYILISHYATRLEVILQNYKEILTERGRTKKERKPTKHFQ